MPCPILADAVDGARSAITLGWISVNAGTGDGPQPLRLGGPAHDSESTVQFLRVRKYRRVDRIEEPANSRVLPRGEVLGATT
jgi:hypothetical protein